MRDLLNQSNLLGWLDDDVVSTVTHNHSLLGVSDLLDAIKSVRNQCGIVVGIFV